MENSWRSWKGELSIRQQFATISVWRRVRQVHLSAFTMLQLEGEKTPKKSLSLSLSPLLDFSFLWLSSSQSPSPSVSLSFWSSPSLARFISFSSMEYVLLLFHSLHLSVSLIFCFSVNCSCSQTLCAPCTALTAFYPLLTGIVPLKCHIIARYSPKNTPEDFFFLLTVWLNLL